MRVTASIKCTIIIEFDDDGSNLDLRDQAYNELQNKIGLGSNIEIADSEPAKIEDTK